MITRLRPYLLSLPIVCVAWLVLMAGVMRITGDAPSALVLMPPDTLIANLPADIAITSRGPFSITLKSAMPNLTAILYAAGAPIVLPAGLTGCLPQS